MKKEKTLKSNILYQGRVLTFRVDDVEVNPGVKTTREIVNHPGGACILAIIDDKIILEKQYRYPYKCEIIELPAGKIEKGEDPLNTAKRELEEETGYIAHKIEKLGEVYPSVGYTDEIIHLYLATELEKTHTHFDADEDVDLIFVSKEEALEMINDGRIKDAKTQVAILKYLQNN